MTTIERFHQFRTADQIYLFQTKGSDTLRLKIYDSSHQRIFKGSCTVNSTLLPGLFENPRAITLLSHFQPTHLLPSDSPPPLYQDPVEELRKLIQVFKSMTAFENKELEASSLNCPLTLDVFRDPVMDSCGHNFEKTEIEKQRKKDGSLICPLSCVPIKSLTPNLDLKQQIEQLRAKDPIPTFSNCKKENSAVASSHLQTAETLVQQGEYQAAIDTYTLAFQYTKKWQDYQKIPLLYAKMEQFSYIKLANLYLAYYQLQAQAHAEALQTLERLYERDPTHSFVVFLGPLLAHLYVTQNKHDKALLLILYSKIVPACENKELKAKLLTYVLHHCPTHRPSYLDLSTLLATSAQKAHLFLRGACHAIESKHFAEAEKFYKLAMEHDPVPLLNHYPMIQIQFQDPSDPCHLQAYKTLLTLFKMYANNPALKSSAVKVYRKLYDDEKFFSIERNLSTFLSIQMLCPKSHKAIHWTTQTLRNLLLEKNDEQAILLAEIFLKLSKDPPSYPPFYETLMKLVQLGRPSKELLNRLAETYTQKGEHSLAESCYRQAFEQFPTYDQAIKFANCLATRTDGAAKAAQIYYEALTLSLQSDELGQEFDKSIESVKPFLNYLQAAQKTQVFTWLHLSKLQANYGEAKKQITDLQFKNQQLEFELQNLRKEPMLDSEHISVQKKELQEAKQSREDAYKMRPSYSPRETGIEQKPKFQEFEIEGNQVVTTVSPFEPTRQRKDQHQVTQKTRGSPARRVEPKNFSANSGSKEVPPPPPAKRGAQNVRSPVSALHNFPARLTMSSKGSTSTFLKEQEAEDDERSDY